jgi:hypothetical protein
MLIILDGLAALPLSNEEYIARTRGELERPVPYLRRLHMHELGRDNTSMKTILHKYDEMYMRNGQYLGDLHADLGTAVVVFGRGSIAVKSATIWKSLAQPAHQICLLLQAVGFEAVHRQDVLQRWPAIIDSRA